MGVWKCLLCAVVIGCSSKAPEQAAPRCGAGTADVDGQCVPWPAACGDVEVPKDGACVAVGVPKDGCAPGFQWESGGCRAVLPAAPCADGMTATPGDEACRAVSECTADAPSDAIHVDAGYAGGASDGSAAKPFVTITDALAAGGATIAVAAGHYAETLDLRRPVTLIGRCASMVTLEGVATDKPALTVSSNSTVRGFAVTGPHAGVDVVRTEATLENLWIHDTGSRGLAVEYASAKVTARGLLIERASDSGVFVGGGTLTLEKSEVRATKELGTVAGVGVFAQPDPTGTLGQVTVRGSVLRGNQLAGLALSNAIGTLEGTTVVDTVVSPFSKKGGVGVSATPSSSSKVRSKLTVIASTFEGNHQSGINADGSDVTVERTTIRRVLSRADGYSVGLQATTGSVVGISGSLIEQVETLGIAAKGSNLTLASSIVRDLGGDAKTAFGIGVQASMSGTVPSELTLDTVLVANVRTTGVSLLGSHGTVKSSWIQHVQPDPTGLFGDGLEVSHDFTQDAAGSLELFDSVVVGAARASVLVAGSALAIGRSTLRCGALDVQVTAAYHAGKEAPFTLDDQGSNACGCDQVSLCKAQDSSLEPSPAR